MKHSDISSELMTLQIKEQIELRAALMAHGNSYTWWDVSNKAEVDFDDRERVEEGELEIPCITIIPKYYGTPHRMAVCKAMITDRNEIVIMGFELDSPNTYITDCDIDEVKVGHLGFIMDMIPETLTVKDVTLTNSNN